MTAAISTNPTLAAKQPGCGLTAEAGSRARAASRWGGWIYRFWLKWLEAFAPRQRSRPPLLAITEKLDLGPKKSLLVIACGERRFLVASGAETIAAMLEIRPDGPDLSGARDDRAAYHPHGRQSLRRLKTGRSRRRLRAAVVHGVPR